MLPEDDRMIETCRSVVSVLIVNFKINRDYISVFVCYRNKMPCFIRNLVSRVKVFRFP